MNDKITEILSRHKPPSPIKSKPIKKKKKELRFKAEWAVIDGKRNYYRSSWELNYAYYLNWLKKNSKIMGWLHEPQRFDFHVVNRGNNSYLPDFKIFNLDGTHEFHEIKGFMNAASKTKLKRFAKFYPNEKLILIDSKTYKQLSSQVSRIVPGWKELT